jgi:hypothetical protein
MRHAGHVVDSVHRSHQLTLDGAKGTQTLYLKDVDETLVLNLITMFLSSNALVS